MLHSKKLTGDVIIIGNSRSYRSFDISFLQKKYNVKKVTNLSKDGNPTIVSEINLRNFTNLIGKPNIVIMEFSNLFNDEEAILNFRPFQGKNAEIDNIINLYYPKYYLFGEIFHLFRFNTTHTILLLYKIVNTNFNNILIGKKEFYIDNTSKNNYKFKSFRHSKIFDDNIISLKKIIKFSKKNNIDLRILISPIHKNDYQTINQKKLFLNYFPNIKLWDFSEINNINENDFYDINHLNSNGVKKFMNELEKRKFFN